MCILGRLDGLPRIEIASFTDVIERQNCTAAADPDTIRESGGIRYALSLLLEDLKRGVQTAV